MKTFNSIIALNLWRGHKCSRNITTIILRFWICFTYPLEKFMAMIFSSHAINVYTVVTAGWLARIALRHVWDVMKLLDYRHRALYLIKRQLSGCSSLQDWVQLAAQYESKRKEFFGLSRGIDINSLYDKTLMKKKLLQLETNQAEYNRNIYDFMNKLRFDLSRNFGNVTKNKLQQHFMYIPETIRKYTEGVKQQLKMIVDAEIPLTDKIVFFRETRHTFGRTALVLSGGASLGTFHMGVIKALFEHGVLPRIISGSSVGSIVASIISVRTNDELRDTFEHLDKLDYQFFSEHETISLVKNFLEKGHAHDDKHLILKLRIVLGDYTFKEAYTRTGRILNVSVCPAETNEPPRILNYLTAPSVVIWSAVAASAAFPGLFPSQHIQTKLESGELQSEHVMDRKWIDGSIENDLPLTTLSEMFNCNYFIVSQCSPQVLPFLNIKRALNDKIGTLIETELKHRCHQLQILLPNWVPTKWLGFFSQQWEGDVTITLPVSFNSIIKIVTNPTIKDIVDLVKMGEKTAWKDIWAIDSNCEIERFLDEQVKTLCGGEASWGIETSDVTQVRHQLQYPHQQQQTATDITTRLARECCYDMIPSILELISLNANAPDSSDDESLALDYIDC